MRFEWPSGIDLNDVERYERQSLDYFDLDLSRVSEVLRFQLYVGYKYRLFDSSAVSDVLKHLEGNLPSSITKQSDVFLRKPLKGLRKKHWADARQLMRNAINEVKEKRVSTPLKNQIDQFFSENEGKLLDEKLQGELAHIYTIGAFESRASRKALTGHWLIYAEHQQKNYYLTIATHDEGDDLIYDRIKNICFQEFYFLERLLND